MRIPFKNKQIAIDATMHEDEEIELSMEAALERKAESMSLSSYERAVDAYREDTCGLFESKFSEPDAPTYGESLANKLEMSAKKMSFGLATPELLTPDECDRLIAAFQLSYDIHYSEYTYVGNGGNSSEGSEFDEEERWESSEETDIRDTICDAAMKFCVVAGSIAKEIGAKREVAQFARCIVLIETNCSDGRYENDVGGMGKKDADLVVGWMFSANASLWAQIKIHRQFMSRHTPNPVAKLTTEQKRWDELMAKSFAGTITKPEVDELMSLASMGKKIVAVATDAASVSPVGDLDKPIKLGEWAKKVVNSVDEKNRVIVFMGGLGGNGASHSIPKASNAAWIILRLLLESDDPDGWTVLPENLRKTWKQQFYRVNKNPDLLALRRHIYSNNKPGQRGMPKIRLERRERKTRRK